MYYVSAQGVDERAIYVLIIIKINFVDTFYICFAAQLIACILSNEPANCRLIFEMV